MTSEVKRWRSHDVEKTRNKRDGGATAIAAIVIGAVFSAAGTAVSAANGVPAPSNGAGPDGGCMWNVEAGCSKLEDMTCPPRSAFTLTSPYEFVKTLRRENFGQLDGWGRPLYPGAKTSERVPSLSDPRTNAHCGSK